MEKFINNSRKYLLNSRENQKLHCSTYIAVSIHKFIFQNNALEKCY